MTKVSMPPHRFGLGANTLAGRFLAIVERRGLLADHKARPIILEVLTHVGLVVTELTKEPYFGERQEQITHDETRPYQQQENALSGWSVTAANRKQQTATILLEELWQLAACLIRSVETENLKAAAVRNAVQALTNELERIAGFPPIPLSPFGDYIEDRPGIEGRGVSAVKTSEHTHLKDADLVADYAMKTQLSQVKHGPCCLGQIRALPLSPTHVMVTCMACNYYCVIPRVETFGDLRREMAKILAATNP